jgi:hypothetical protein
MSTAAVPTEGSLLGAVDPLDRVPPDCGVHSRSDAGFMRSRRREQFSMSNRNCKFSINPFGIVAKLKLERRREAQKLHAPATTTEHESASSTPSSSSKAQPLFALDA